MGFIKNLIRIRKEKKLSLQDVANLSGVSKSMLSKIEREEKNPTLQIAAQIAEGLGTTLSAMLATAEQKAVVLIKPEQRVIYRDEASGFERQLLSPAFSTKGIEFILNKVPMGGAPAYFPPHKTGVKEYLVVTQGSMSAELGDTRYLLSEGDSLYFEADIQHRFINTGKTECRYYLVINSYESAP